MKRNRRNMAQKNIFRVVCFGLVFVFVFLGIQFYTKTGVFKIPGKVIYENSLDENEKKVLDEIFNDKVVLDKDVKVSAFQTDSKPYLAPGEYVYNVIVPVTDFYDERSDINEFSNYEYEYIPIEELNFQKKLLAVDGDYFLTNFDKGAKFRIIKFSSEKFDEEIRPLVEATFNKSFPSKDSVLSFAQTGVTAMARGMNAKLNTVGDASYFSEKIKDYLSSFDLTHTSNEASFTDLATVNNICSDPRFINTLISIGLDIVELTGNHNLDCGSQAALDTIDIYQRNNIKTVGGGKNINEAAIPLELKDKATNITFLAYNLSTGGVTYGDEPGANQYDEENVASNIKAAKERGDFVLVDIQYYECSEYDDPSENTTCDYADSAAGDQIGFFRHLIDLGADVVVGTSAHQPQTFELYGDGVIYYGLGNLFFDQIWWPGTTRSLILEHYFYNGKLLQTRITPTIYSSNMQTELLDPGASKWFIKRLVSARP